MNTTTPRVASTGDALGLHTKDNVIYLGEVVEYDRPSYAPPGHDLVYGVDIESAHRIRPGEIEPAPEEIPSDELPDEIEVPDGFHDGITTVTDSEAGYVLLEWSAQLRPDSIMFAPRDPVVVDCFVSDDIMTPERVLHAVKQHEGGCRL